MYTKYKKSLDRAKSISQTFPSIKAKRNPAKMFQNSITHETLLCVRDKMEEKETLNVTEHDKYQNIAGSVRLSLFMSSNGSACYS
jgi:hypothetical protein